MTKVAKFNNKFLENLFTRSEDYETQLFTHNFFCKLFESEKYYVYRTLSERKNKEEKIFFSLSSFYICRRNIIITISLTLNFEAYIASIKK